MAKSKQSLKDEKSNQDHIHQLEQNYKRALADYQNLQKRLPQDVQRRVTFEKKQIFANVLHILDNLERAQQHLNDPGIKITIDNFITYLKSQGVEEIATDSLPFDPQTMECIEKGPDESEIVTQTLSKGYRLEETVLRPAQVVVGKTKTQ